MITGHNTDVRYGDVVLHVQTEDKGQANPCIESLIYFGGQVVVAKRGNYADMLQEGKGDTDIMALMDHQHRTMIKAIQAGKFDDKIEAFLPDKSKLPSHAGPPPDSAGLDIAAESARTLDQVILEYLTSEAEQEQLLLMMDDDVEIRAGSKVELTLRARSSKSGEPIEGADVNVKMISTFGGPRILGAGQTDEEGMVSIPVEIPTVDRGTAAMIITAESAIGQQELKHLL